MRWLAPLIVVCALGCRGSEEPSVPQASSTEFRAENGTTVFADFVKASGKAKGVVLMFHQAGSNRHEYDPIAPRIAGMGWDCLQVDQRAGGDMWGAKNETREQFSGETHYWDAYADLEAALAWATEKGYKRIVAWGSSYSASLVLKLASENDSVSAVVSFSPGEYFDEEGIVAGWNKGVKVPGFYAATSEELATGVYSIIDAKQSPANELDVVFGTRDGSHGSSALREDKNPLDYKAYWEKLELFFRSLETGGNEFGG